MKQRLMSASKDFTGASSPSPQTVTKEQRLDLIRDRARYQLHQDFRPKYSHVAKVHEFVEKMREQKIAHIDKRLNKSQEKLQTDRLRGVHNGRAKAGFNHSNAHTDMRTK